MSATTHTPTPVRQRKQQLPPPRRYGVFLHNDDYTTMDFVVDILRGIFNLPEDEAVRIMLQIHRQGRGLCGIYQRDIAETKCMQVEKRAREAGFPLLATVEEI